MESKKTIYELLRSKYPTGEYALLSEVRDASGFSASRSADYMAFHLWPSRGHAIIGFEQKISRTDWLREFKNPKKAEAIFKYCDQFYLVTSDETVANLSEIPITWGWMAVVKGRLKVIKDAPQLTPVTLDKAFIGAALKRACMHHKDLVLKSDIEDVIEKGVKERTEWITRDKERLEKDVDKLNKIITDFESYSGIALRGWRCENPKKTAEAVKFVVEGGIEKLNQELNILRGKAKKIFDNIDSIINENASAENESAA